MAKHKLIPLPVPLSRPVFTGTVLRLLRSSPKVWRVVGALLVVGLLFAIFQTFIAVRVSYAPTGQSVVSPFAIHFNRAVGSIDTRSLSLSPRTNGSWSVQHSTLGNDTLEFIPTNGFKPATRYTLAPIAGKRLIGGALTFRSINFTTVRAPAVEATGIVTLADESTIAPDASFTVKLSDPNNNIRKLELLSTPQVPVALTTSDQNTLYTWHPKQLLPSGKTIQLEVFDARSGQAIVQKQVVIASTPGIANFNEPTNFSQGDTARITFNKPIDTATASVHFDVAGNGTWSSPTVYTFTPTTVQPGQTYHYTVAAGLRSTDGGLTNQPLTGSFSTVGHVDITNYAPTGSKLNQANQTIHITFNQAVDHQSAANHFSISSGTVTSESWDGNTFLAAVSNLGYDQKITVTIASGVANAGFGLPSDHSTEFSFHTDVETGVAAQLAYAVAHWDDTNNTTYGNLDPVGGDCSNFVSQTLIARGWHMDSTWYNHGPSNWSAAWGYVPSLDDYLWNNRGSFGLNYLTASQRSQYAVGDIVVFSWEGTPDAATQEDHVEMISRITNQNGHISVALASHNNYGLYRDLDEQITVEHPGATYHVYHLTRDTN